MSRITETLTTALVRRAARTGPTSLAARLEEEWLADLQERTSSLSRLRFALGCYWASLAIGLEHRPLSVPVVSAAHGTPSMLLEPPRFLSSRAVTFGLVVSLHVAVLFGLMMARTTYFKAPEPPPIEPRVIDRAAQPPVKPEAPEFKPSFVDQHLTPPVFPPVEPVTPTVPKIADDPLPSQPPGISVAPRAREVVRVPGGTGRAFPHPDEYYPDASRRMEEQGAAVLDVCVDAAGRLSSDPVRSESSGSARLDAAAIKLAKAGSGHYRPATEDGRPVPSCYQIKIRFQLRN